MPGGREFGPDEAQRYAAFFGVTAEWLLTGYAGDVRARDGKAYPAAPGRTASIFGYIGKGAEGHLFALNHSQLDMVPVPELATPATVALEIRGKSMGAHLDRWFVLYEDRRSPPTADLIGELCVVALEDQRVLLKELRRSPVKGFDLFSQAAAPIRQVNVVWAAGVKAVIQQGTLLTKGPQPSDHR
jgi:hypothetical protein